VSGPFGGYLTDHFHVAQRGLASLHEASVVCACSY